jgi:RNA polymerase sigma-70 factor, ECF subfamily
LNPNIEANLIEQIAHGDEAAFGEVYHRYRNRIYGFSRRMTSNQTLAEDITHEVFLVLIENPKRYYAERGSLLTFLCAIARNLMLNHLRRKHHRDVGFEEFEDFDAAEDAARGNPLSDLLNQELSARIEACIAALPPLQREAIILREFEELSYEEIGKITDTELSTVKARLHRARQNLAKQLAAFVDSPTKKKDKCYELH